MKKIYVLFKAEGFGKTEKEAKKSLKEFLRWASGASYSDTDGNYAKWTRLKKPSKRSKK